jgi:bacterioferritin-associated ferredoxin
MKTKKCYKCEKDLSLDSFKSNKNKKDGLQSQCIECQRSYRREHYLKNKQKYIDKAKAWEKRFFEWWKDYKTKFVCELCGEDHPACLDFHHLDRNTKDLSVSEFVSKGNKAKLLKEVKKCMPVCSNCHRKIHWEEKRELK